MSSKLFSFSHRPTVSSNSSLNIHNALYFVKYPSRAAQNSPEGRRRPAGRGFNIPGLHDIGCLAVQRPDAGARRTRRNRAFEEHVLRIIFDNPSTSTGSVARALNASKSSVNRVLRTEQIFPFHLHKVQALELEDFGCLLDFCNWVLNQYDVQPDFVSDVLFTDEDSFTRDGLILNHRNSHVWDYVQPNALVEGNHQHKFSINIWAGIIANHIIGLYLLPL